MSIFKVHAATTITVSNHRNLLAAWKTFGGTRSITTGLISSFNVEKPLTAAQLRRLPGELRARVSYEALSV